MNEQGRLQVAAVIGTSNRRLELYRRTYPLRKLGMGLAVLPALVLLGERQAGWIAWAFTLFCGFIWPHLAWLHARFRRDPHQAELTNFMIDSAMAGSLAALMHFNLLPTVVLATVATADKINSGVRGLWSRALAGMLASALATAWITGFRVDVVTGMPALLACLPLLIIHTLTVSASSYRLIRKVQAQNLRLDEISRHDTLTGLQTRRHWQEQARALLADNARNGMPASLLLLDVDLFKSINDDHGHAIGDDVLRGIADAIRHAIPAGSHAGRLGGDEFAVAVPLPLSETHVLAEHIRNRVQALNHDIPGVRCSVSIGLAEPSSPDIDLRGWMEDADRALYRAKAAGRNLAHAAEQPVEFVEP